MCKVSRCNLTKLEAIQARHHMQHATTFDSAKLKQAPGLVVAGVSRKIVNTDSLEVDEGDLPVLCTSDGAEKMDWPICFQSTVIFIESCSNLVCHACCRAIICLPSFISHRPAICYLYTVLIVHTLHPYSHYCFFMHGYFRLWRSVDECRKEKTEVAPV